MIHIIHRREREKTISIKIKKLVRTHLEEEISRLWRKSLLIITAPSGYGKTTLFKQFIKKHKSVSVVWVSWGQEEVDEAWVWKRFCLKCVEISEELSGKLNRMEVPRSPQEVESVKEIIKSFLCRPTCLVIDDFQKCDSEPMNRLVTMLACDEIPGFHIVLISRIHPELPYGEMILKGYCATIDQSMLSLSRKETDEVFRINGVTLNERELTEVFEYTDGWISAVYLTLYDYSRNGRVGTFSSAAHLFKTAIFDKLTPLMQSLYMKMSLFESFTLEAAIYITELDILPAALTEAIESYGFIQYDSLTREYRMHSLFKNVASGELERRGIDKKYLYHRGGEWCELNQEPIKAVVNYRKAGDLTAILKLLSGEERFVVIEAVPAILNEIFMSVPAELKAEYQAAWLSYIYHSVMKGDLSDGVKLYEEACSVFSVLCSDERKAQEMKGELLIIGSLLEFNDLEKTNALLTEAYELLGRQSSRIFRQTMMTYGAPFMTLLYYNRAGSLDRVIELEKQYARFFQRLVGCGDGGWDDLFDAEYALLTGDMERAGQLALKVQMKAVFSRQACIVISSYDILFKALIYHGQKQECERKMRELQDYMKTLNRPMLIVDAELVYGYYCACLGKKEDMADWLKDYQFEDCSRVLRNAKSGYMAYGMLLCRTQQWMLLDAIADQILEPNEKTIHIYSVIRGYLYKAVAAYHLEGAGQSQRYLKKAVELAEQDGVRSLFIENSPELLPIMEGMKWNGAFISSLKTGMKQYAKSLRAFTEEKRPVILTAREMELLELVKAGYRNGDISRELNIALVTVEKTLTAIYRKLGVPNRAAAAAIWREQQDYKK